MAVRRVHMQLKVEELEPRIAPAGVEPVVQAAYEVGSSVVSPTWFQAGPASLSDAGQDGGLSGVGTESDEAIGEMEWKGATVTAYTSEWIVQLSSDALDRITSVAEAANVFAGSNMEINVVRGLGMAGQLLVDTGSAAMSDIENWFSSCADIAYYEPNFVATTDSIPNDPSFSKLWGLNNTGQTGGTVNADINAPEAWNISTGSRSVVVAVIDTGVDYTHPDLAANIWTNPGEIPGNGIDDDRNGFVDDVHGYNFVSNTGNPMDDNNHGTHVAGTIGAVGNNGVGVAGVNWTTSIMALKFLSASGSGSTANAVRAINYATMMRTQYGVNVRVESNSWGGGGYDQTLYNAIAATGNAGILFVAAAGNSARNNDTTPTYPASYNLSNIIAVAATDSNDKLASFSCYGPTSVDLGAPGVSIYSTVPGGSYASYSGTSMATPHVSGVAALAWSANPNASAQQVRSAILAGVDPISSLSGKVATGGRLDAVNTLNLITGGVTLPTVSIVATDPNAAEQGLDPGLFTVSRTGSTAAALTVNYAIGGTATNGVDYNTLSGSVTIGAGAASATITVEPIDDTIYEGSETVILSLSSSSQYLVGSPNSATVTIADNDAPPLPTVNITATDPNAAEQGRDPGVFTITRTGSTTSKLVVNYSIGGTATNGVDYTKISGSATIAAGSSSTTVTIRPVDDKIVEPTETVVLSLASSSSYSIGSSRTATVSIVDNDQPPVSHKYGKANLALPIRDFQTITSTLTISDSYTISDLDVQLNIAHTYDSDLTVTLTGPSGVKVTLFKNVGGSKDNFTNTVLDDEATSPIASGKAPFSGSFKPQTALSAFDGMSVTGTWTLSISDSYRNDTGTLTSWSLTVSTQSVAVKGLMEEEIGDEVVAFTPPTPATRPGNRPDMGLLVWLYAGGLGVGGSRGSESSTAMPQRAGTMQSVIGTIEVRSALLPQTSSPSDLQWVFGSVSGHGAMPADRQGVAREDGLDSPSRPAIIPARVEAVPAVFELEGLKIVRRIN